MSALFDPCERYARRDGCLSLYLEDCCTTCRHLDDEPPCATLRERWVELAGPVPRRPLEVSPEIPAVPADTLAP